MTSTPVERFFDNRAAYLMFTTATNEKAVVADRIGRELDDVHPGESALRIFDAGMGDGSVLSQLMRRMHRVFTHIPWLVVGKEISIEDVRIALGRMPDRLYEHPEMVLVVTNMNYREAPTFTPTSEKAADPTWIEAPLEGSTADDFGRQIHDLFDRLADAWEVVTSPRTGNPLYARPSALVLYRKDREFLLKRVIPRLGETDGEYDLIVASQPYRARTSAERKVRLVLVPLARALAPGGRMIVVHAHGGDPGLEIIRNVWPDEDPFQTGRRELLAEAQRQLTDPVDANLVYPESPDEDAIFRYELHAMPSERTEHIGTGLTLAAWNAAAYVAQIDESRLAEAMASGVYVPATRDVLERYGGIWFNDEAYLIVRSG
jgi:glycosyltransferase involved in cell wall biosynthesis